MFDYVEFLEQKLAEAGNARKTTRTELQIEIATATLLRSKAYHSISVNMIAEQANLAHGTFYRYFAGKRDVVAKTLADYFEFVRTTRPAVPPGASDLEAIEIGNRNYVRCFRQNVGLMRCHFHLKDEDDLIAQVGRDADKGMSERIIRRIRRGRIVSDAELPELRLRTYCLISMVDELLLKIYGQTNPPLAEFADDPDMVASTVSRLWHAALYETEPLSAGR
ncbi:TetR/AcrR family transcriptional regulator [Mesorhizobium sp. CAU 1732]|uniref:TetR/AcrR family transcriptional regulator n=1 Tax=Mesorhizobium sp. CAU 1732 TaxID=3140358 RepID=UPI0032612A61